MAYEYLTCRHCLGNGCTHCAGRGQWRRRVFTAGEVAADKLRRQLGMGATGQFNQEREKTLAFLRAK